MILFGANTDTELLARRSATEDLPAALGEVRWFHPDRLDGVPEVGEAHFVVLRLLGGVELWEEGLAELQRRCIAAEVPLVTVGGEREPDPELLGQSTVPSGGCHRSEGSAAAKSRSCWEIRCGRRDGPVLLRFLLHAEVDGDRDADVACGGVVAYILADPHRTELRTAH